MAPVGLMLLLVALLTAVSLGARTRLHRAYDAQTVSQEIRTDLIEVRSLSRSLQRDALSLLVETDAAELKVLQEKYRSRTRDMRVRLDRLVRNPGFTDAPQRQAYLTSQWVVLDRLTTTADFARRGQLSRALATFRREVRPNERAASRIADAMIAEQDTRVAKLQRRTAEIEQQEVLLSTLASLILFAVAATITLLIVRRTVLAPLTDIETALTLVAKGDTAGATPHVQRHDEIGRMARAIEVFRASTREREALREQEVHRRQLDAQQALEREQARRREEEAVSTRTAALARSAQLLEAQLSEVLRSLRSSSTQLTATSHKLAKHSSSAKGGLSEVGSAVARALNGATDIAAATDQFTMAIAAASERTRRSADLSAGSATESALLASKMERVQNASEAIEEVVNLIAGIAKQTNLLALNARVEAARAGDAGQGFAVVADEVKQLARQTAQATDSIAGQIAEMQLAARDAGDSLRQIKAMIADLASEAEALARSIDEQAASGRVINHNLGGAADDLKLIDGRVADVTEVASGVDALAHHVAGDAATLETSAATIDRALSIFFAELDQVRAAALEGRSITAL
jgi:methyl-accepting chemotaxis protein